MIDRELKRKEHVYYANLETGEVYLVTIMGHYADYWEPSTTIYEFAIGRFDYFDQMEFDVGEGKDSCFFLTEDEAKSYLVEHVDQKSVEEKIDDLQSEIDRCRKLLHESEMLKNKKTKLNIVISAGGTSEMIDNVRKITNSSSGTLGALIAEAILRDIPNVHIDYVAPRKAKRPEFVSTAQYKDAITYHEVTDTASVKETMDKLITVPNCWVIHSMAISDYTVGEIRDENDEVIDKSKKISSSHPILHMDLIPTPKVLDGFKKINPNIKLIGFKLLNGATEDELYEAATTQAIRAKCDYVLMNDLKNIGPTKHEAKVIKYHGESSSGSHCFGISHRLHTKPEIAKYIAQLIIIDQEKEKKDEQEV